MEKGVWSGWFGVGRDKKCQILRWGGVEVFKWKVEERLKIGDGYRGGGGMKWRHKLCKGLVDWMNNESGKRGGAVEECQDGGGGDKDTEQY